MQGDEQVGMIGAGDGNALAQRNEDVAVARHVDGIAARFQRPRQLQSFRQRQVFFLQAVDTHRAAVQAAMAGIDHDDFVACAADRRGLLRRDHSRQFLRIAFALLQVGGPAGLGIELGAGGGEQVDHHAIAEPRRRRQHQRVGHCHRRIQVDHHARIAGAEGAIAIGLDRPLPAGPWRRAQPPRHFRHVDHHAVGIGQRKGAQVDRIGQFDHQPGAVFMLADARTHDQRQRPGRPGAHGRSRARGRQRLGRCHGQSCGAVILAHQPADGVVLARRRQRQQGGGKKQRKTAHKALRIVSFKTSSGFVSPRGFC